MTRLQLLPTVVGFLALLALCGTFAWAKLRPVPADASYVGSARCEGCHSREHGRWSASLHSQMMRPANQPGVVVADFSSDDPGLRFERADAVWAIGGKWEQQFMGHDGLTETLLPGVWRRASETWDFRGWDGWQEPVPLRRCHGCHTVGLDVETGGFVEASVGCESCHGPGSWHASTGGLGRIYSSTGADVCGQCHTRGRSVSGEYFFPVDFRPGEDLATYFESERPSPGQNSTSWWGNGHERKRHQEHWAWSQGGHANSLATLRDNYDGRYGALSDDCLGCHSGDYILSSRNRPDLRTAKYGITCAVCHNVHGDLDQPRQTCQSCHVEGAFYHQPAKNRAHVACPLEAGVGCVNCHMPTTARTGGEFAIHTHRSGVIPPSDTEKWGTPSSCSSGGCHAQDSTKQLQALFDEYYRLN